MPSNGPWRFELKDMPWKLCRDFLKVSRCERFSRSHQIVAENIVETFRVLVVSRESAVLRPLWSIAENNAWQVESAVSAWDAMERMHSSVAPHVFLLDVPRGDGDTLHILRWMRRLRPDLPVIVICCGEDSG